MNFIMYGIELIQLVDFVLQFCLEYKEIDKTEPVRELYKTAMRYANNEMIYDLIPLIPFQWMFHHRYSRLYFAIKCFRIKKSMSLLDTTKFMEVINAIYQKRLIRACEDPKLANDQVEDNNEIMAQIWIQTIFKTFRLVVIIFLISYYLGMLFYVFSDVMNDIPPFPGDETEYYRETGYA